MNSGGSISHDPCLVGGFWECITLVMRFLKTAKAPPKRPDGRPSGRDLTDKLSYSEKRKTNLAQGWMLSSTAAFGGISDIRPWDACPARDNIPRGAEGGGFLRPIDSRHRHFLMPMHHETTLGGLATEPGVHQLADATLEACGPDQLAGFRQALALRKA
jgi:hypothetical protein